MARSYDDNVVTLPLRASQHSPSPEFLKALRRVVDTLDVLSDGFEAIKPNLHWSRARWNAASTPFRMRLVAAEQQVEELRKIDPAAWPEIGWAIDLSSARTEFEQQLQVVVRLLDLFLHGSMSTNEQEWQVQRFTAGSKEFLAALRRLRLVIVARHPAVRQLQ
jgi:hypothetical protein